jgi:hypothetical protein
VKQGTKILDDAILSIISGVPLIITKNISHAMGLINGAIIEFYGFVNTHGQSTDHIISLPEYILVKVSCDKVMFQIPSLPVNVVPVESISFRHNSGHGRYVDLRQFPVTLTQLATPILRELGFP